MAVRFLTTSPFKICIVLAFVGSSILLGCGRTDNTPAADEQPSVTPTAPSAPTNLSLSGDPTLTDSPTLTWTASTGSAPIFTYKIGIGTSAGADDILAFSNVGNVTSHQFMGIAPSLSVGTNYYITVSAIDNEGMEGASASSVAWSPALVLDDGAYRLPETSYHATCADYMADALYNSEGDGQYWLDIDGAGPRPPMKGTCDQTTEGGGWLVVLNYIHQGGTNPATTVLFGSLPLQSSAVLGDDDSANTASWGHVSNALFNDISVSEIRMNCQTSNHSREIHFRTTHTPSISYFSTGLGRMLGVQSQFTPMTGHTANLPAASSNFNRDRLEEAMVRSPFAVPGTFHWIIGWGSRWECDDYANGFAFNTLHRIWVR